MGFNVPNWILIGAAAIGVVIIAVIFFILWRNDHGT
jgi:hypothetical protein